MAASGSILNAVWVFWRTRRYRLFEASIEQGPGTPSAQRVRVQSSPASSSPMRLLSTIMSTETAESRAHPDNTRDVWELAVWDPLPICLQLLVFFSPLHAMIYMFELPLDPLDARPSVTTVKCIILQVALSTLLHLLQSKNDQRQKDASIIQKEVLHEYDTKYVHPRLHPIVRDVATQVSLDRDDGPPESVESGTPTTLLRRGFHTNPNPNYLKHIDPDSNGTTPSNAINRSLVTPTARPRYSDSFATANTTRSRLSTGTPTQAPAPAAVSSSLQTGSTNFGGNLGAFTHMNSPLKKATSLSNINGEGGFFSPRNSRELAAIEQRELTERMQRRASPLKEDRRHTAGSRLGLSPEPDLPPAPAINPFNRNRGNAHRFERYPSRW